MAAVEAAAAEAEAAAVEGGAVSSLYPSKEPAAA